MLNIIVKINNYIIETSDDEILIKLLTSINNYILTKNINGK